MHVAHEVVRIDIMMLHQPGKRGSGAVEVHLLDAPCLDRVDAEARRVQKMHFHGSGTTLAGLMKHHAVDPHHFMGDVHDIPLDRLARDDRLVSRAGAASGPQVHPHQRQCRLCVEGARPARHRRRVDHLHDIFAADLTPAGASRLSQAARPVRHRSRTGGHGRGHGPQPAPAKALGMTTVWVDNGSERGNHGYDDAIVDVRIDRCQRMARKRFRGRRMSDECRR